MAWRVAVVGGGPGGLFLARMLRLLDPAGSVEVVERARGEDAPAGFGVTLSERTMAGLAQADPDTTALIEAAGLPLAGVEVRIAGRALRYPGFPSAAIGRRALLDLLRAQAVAAGARIRFGRELAAGDPLPDADVVVLADGARSAHRDRRRARFGTRTRTGRSRFVWLGTPAVLGDAAHLVFAESEHGPVAAHCYPYGPQGSTVVAELDEATWRRSGLSAMRCRHTGGIDQDGLHLLTDVFAEHLEGHKLTGEGSRWGRFAVVRNERWHAGRTVLLGDAAHTAHFTVSSGTRLAMEDAAALAAALAATGDLPAALADYEAARRGPVERIQALSEASMQWWETFGARTGLPPEQFGLHFLTRTGALSERSLRRRCRARLAAAERSYLRSAGGQDEPGRHAFAAPAVVGGWRLSSRLVRVGARTAGRAEIRVDGGRTLRFAAAGPPAGPPWSAAGDALVAKARTLRACGVPGLLLGGPAEPDPDRLLGHACRVRNEARLPVAVPAPPGWSPAAATDPWTRRLHLELVAGRIDLVALPAAAEEKGTARPAIP